MRDRSNPVGLALPQPPRDEYMISSRLNGGRARFRPAMIFHQGFDFRGDNDQSWARAAELFIDRIARDPPQ